MKSNDNSNLIGNATFGNWKKEEIDRMNSNPEYAKDRYIWQQKQLENEVNFYNSSGDTETANIAKNRLDSLKQIGQDGFVKSLSYEEKEIQSELNRNNSGSNMVTKVKDNVTNFASTDPNSNKFSNSATNLSRENAGFTSTTNSLSNANRYSGDKLKNAQYEYDIKMHTPSGANLDAITKSKNLVNNIGTADLNSKKYSNNKSSQGIVSFGNARTSINSENRYSSDKLKNAQYEYEVKMHTPSLFVAKLNSTADLSGVIGSRFGNASKSVLNTGTHALSRTAKDIAQMGMGAVANDEGTRKVSDALKYTTMTTAAVFGDVKDLGDRSFKAMKNASNLAAGLEIKGLTQLNKNTLIAHWGKSDISKLGEMELKKGCISYLRSKGINITEDLLKGNTAKVITRLNKIIKMTSDKEVIAVVQALKGSVIKTPLNKPKKFNFRLLNVGILLGSNLKYKFLSNEDMKGLSVLIQSKDRILTVIKTILRFFHNVAKAGQKGAVLARKATLLLKKTKIYEKINTLKTQKLIKKYYKNYGKKGTKKLAKKIRKRTSKTAEKSLEKGAKVGLRAQMAAIRNTIVKKVVGAAIKKFAATKAGQFIVTKIGETAVFHAVQAFLTDWIPVVGQVKFILEVVIIVLLVIFVVFAAFQVKTVIDEIGNASHYENEALKDYGDLLKECSGKYKAFYKDALNKDSAGTLQRRKVPKLISRMTDNVNVSFTDYMAVESYNSATVNGENLRELYGNQPELIMMAHVMSDFGLDTGDIGVKQKYLEQLRQWYNSSHIMYLSYYQIPQGIENNHPQGEPYATVYDQYWDEDEHIWKIKYTTVRDILYWDSEGPHFGEPHDVPVVIGSCKENPDALKVEWHADFSFDTYYYDNIFDYSETLKADTNVAMYEPQVYINYPKGANSVHSSKYLPLNNEYAKAIMPKVYTAVSDKLDEKHIYNANTMAITCGIVANLICEGGCRGNNYEDSWEQKQNTTDIDVTNSYNECFYDDDGNLVEDINVIWAKCTNPSRYKGPILKDKNGNEIKWYAGGYGIVQWTNVGRKQKLFSHAVEWAKINNTTVDISDVDMQISFMLKEMDGYGYFNSDGIFVTHSDPSSIGYYLCEHYENPATDGTDAKYKARGDLAMQLYNSCNGMVGEIDYDDENIGSYVEYIEYQPNEDGDNEGSSPNSSNLYFADSNPGVLSEYDADFFIAEYLNVCGYRTVDFIDGHTIANIYFGNYGPRKYTLDTGDMIVWRDYAAIYIGNGKVLCVQSLDPLSKKTKVIGKYSMSEIVNIWGGNYKIFAPIKDE